MNLADRQRLIPGSPAPAIIRKQQQQDKLQLQQLDDNRRYSIPGSPKITLSKCKDNDMFKCDIPQFEDTMIEVRGSDLMEVSQDAKEMKILLEL